MIVNGHLTFVTMIVLHILQTNSIAFIVSRTLLSLNYQVKLTWFSGRRITTSMSVQLNNYTKHSTGWAKKPDHF